MKPFASHGARVIPFTLFYDETHIYDARYLGVL